MSKFMLEIYLRQCEYEVDRLMSLKSVGMRVFQCFYITSTPCIEAARYVVR